MERSNYEAFMDCLNPMIQITRAILCGVVLWEKIQECDALGIYIKRHCTTIRRFFPAILSTSFSRNSG